MKTNAPEKIFLHPDIGGKEFIRPWLKKRASQESVEYTRTDAFVEKALKWFDTTFHGTSIDGWGGESVDVVMSDKSVYKDDLFEEFRKYMEGE